LAASHPLRLSEETLQADFGKIAPLLADHGFLKRVDHLSEAECPGAPNACLKTVTPHQGKFYINCDCEEGVGLVTVPKSCLSRVQLDLKAVLEWMSKELGLSGDVEPVQDGESWFLGNKADASAHFYFLRTDSHEQAAKFSETVQKQSPVVLWLGQRPHTGTLPKNLIPAGEAMEPRKKSFVLNRDLLAKAKASARHAVGGKTILLDEHIGMEKEGEVPYLLFEREGSTFTHRKRIRPQAFDLIRLLHGTRNQKTNAFKLGDFVERGLVGSKRTASDRIREINDYCAEFEAKPIFWKFPGDKWGVNPNLDSK